MMGFSPPQPECQVVDREATHYDGDTDDLHELVRYLKTFKERVGRSNILSPSVILAR